MLVPGEEPFGRVAREALGKRDVVHRGGGRGSTPPVPDENPPRERFGHGTTNGGGDRHRPAPARPGTVRAVRARTPKIFGIGLNKTGTRSLAVALRRLGFRTLHKGDDTTSALVDRAAADGLPLLSYIGEKYDAYLDVEAIVRRFAELDFQYPQSKFILSTADEDSWLDSRERHARANLRRSGAGGYEGSWLTVDRTAWRREWHEHHEAVLSHFEDRESDLLVFDVRAGDGWEKLAPFLGCPVQQRVFPWQNEAGTGTYRPERALQSLRRRLDYPLGRLRRLGNR